MTKDAQKTALLIPEEKYLTSGVHIGTQQKSADMDKFIFKVRNDGLYILDVKQTDYRIKVVAKFLSKFDPDKILVVATRQYAQKPAQLFAKSIGAKSIIGRFIPGRLTNPILSSYIEPEVVILNDPIADQQALRESVSVGVPIIGMCDANNETKNIDIILPANNKGRKSLATIYWLLTKEILTERGQEEYNVEIDEFEASI